MPDEAELVRVALECSGPQREDAVLALIEDLRTGGVPGVPWIIAAEAVAEHGASAVPALVAALSSFPVPAQQSADWMRHESAKYRLMHALKKIGPAAAAAVPLLEAISEDGESYRDSRWQAEQALDAINPG